VERGHLKHSAGEHEAALADFDAALRLRPDFADAHRQRADTLLALGRYAEAGKALDRYLAGRQREAAFYRVRGMIHSRLGEHTRAIEAYSGALLVAQASSTGKEEALTRQRRGWAYLQTDAPRLALTDFDTALQLGHRSYQVLCGRALARVRLGEVAEAIHDADTALKLTDAVGPDPALLSACVYARAANLAAAGSPRTRGGARGGTAYLDRAAELLGKALRCVAREQQSSFWRTRVQSEEALAAVCQHPRIAPLARRLAR
jgi:tetratricopeptide (TPR) repeat protein